MAWLALVSTFYKDSKTFELFYNVLWRFHLRVLCLVIGRGGEQISRIQQESGCKIQIAPGE